MTGKIKNKRTKMAMGTYSYSLKKQYRYALSKADYSKKY